MLQPFTTMSYYYALTPETLASHKAAFDDAFTAESSYVFAQNGARPSAASADHIGYLIYRALTLRAKFRRHEANILVYKDAYRVADQSFAAWIRAFGVNEATGEARRMMDRFLAVEDF